MRVLRALANLGSAFRLGTISGIQFRIHYTWFIIFVLVTYSVSREYFPEAYPGWSATLYWTIGIVSSILFFASVVAHELAHSLVARANGMPVQSITLFLFGGIARITREATRARAELVMAAAGPACSLIIGGLCGLLSFFTKGVSLPASAVFFWLAQVNVIVAIFNLIPGFPLDGGRILHSLLWRLTGSYQRSSRIATLVGQGVGYVLIAGGIVMVVWLREWWVSGVWLAFIGWFLAIAAQASYRQTQWQAKLTGVTVSQVMTANYMVVPGEATVRELMQNQVVLNERLVFLVSDAVRLRGTVTLHNIKALPQDEWDVTRVRDLMVPVVQLAYPDQNVLSLLQQMDESDIRQVPVVSEGRVVGVVVREALLTASAGSGSSPA